MAKAKTGIQGEAFVFTPLGGGREIGANAWHIEWDGISFLIDCGMHPERPSWFALPLLSRLKRLDFVLVTHAHSDHSAGLPWLAKHFPAPVWMTSLTKKLLAIMIKDSLKLQRRIFTADRRGAGRISDLGDPPFDEGDAALLFSRISILDEGFTHNGLRITPFSSGHILGAVGLVLEKNGRRVLFTSDIAVQEKESAPPLALPEGPFDLVISEGTRGAETARTGTREQEEEHAMRVMSRIVKRDAKVLFPSFVMERAQSVALLVMRARKEGLIPNKTPLFMAGLADSMTALHSKVLGLDIEYEPIALHEWIPAMNTIKSAIIIAGSGMLSSGSGAARLAETLLSARRKEHALIFPGYCTPASPGGRLLVRERSPISGHTHAYINGHVVDVRSNEIHQIHLSCHADAGELKAIIRGLEARAVILVHGDRHALDILAGDIRKELGKDCPIAVPENGESVSYNGHPAESLRIPSEIRTAEELLQENPWNIQALKESAAHDGSHSGLHTAPMRRLRAVLRLLTEHALRDGKLILAREALREAEGVLQEDEVYSFLQRIEDIACWCPQNDVP
jgi:Cft2 family RNA processing exonuclease